MTSFAEFLADNREKLLSRRSELYLELTDIAAELAAIDAYEQKKREGTGALAHKRTGRYPHEHDDTLSVPQAGKEFLGLSESGSWLAWRRGDIPAIKIGRHRRVPIDAMRKKLEERQPRTPSGGRHE